MTPACAIFLPPRENFLEAMIEALETAHRPECGLYTNGRQMAWLPRPVPGWFRTPLAVNLKEALPCAA